MLLTDPSRLRGAPGQARSAAGPAMTLEEPHIPDAPGMTGSRDATPRVVATSPGRAPACHRNYRGDSSVVLGAGDLTGPDDPDIEEL
ncbi:hypothetical protein GCM10023196_081210 [Actinoallomurus vinaceus]|uniref:Uncharacterized protein n=1 Tax=Actinoallomurus vinaceus TaxID=1080074 RepID=A0ABP8UPF7_9ACTN